MSRNILLYSVPAFRCSLLVYLSYQKIYQTKWVKLEKFRGIPDSLRITLQICPNFLKLKKKKSQISESLTSIVVFYSLVMLDKKLAYFMGVNILRNSSFKINRCNRTRKLCFKLYVRLILGYFDIISAGKLHGY